MRGLQRRLARLECAIVEDGCPHCGGGSGQIGEGTRVNVVVFFENEDDPDPQPDFCPVCGRQLVFRISFDKAG